MQVGTTAILLLVIFFCGCASDVSVQLPEGWTRAASRYVPPNDSFLQGFRQIAVGHGEPYSKLNTTLYVGSLRGPADALLMQFLANLKHEPAISGWWHR